MNRLEFQQLAEVRIREAEALLVAGLWDGAYYLAGYAVECGLKACIAKLTKADDFPDKDRAVKAWTHKLAELLVIADLKAAHDADIKADKNLDNNWTVALRWSEQSRYVRTPEVTARALFVAVTDPASGVLQWIKKYW